MCVNVTNSPFGPVEVPSTVTTAGVVTLTLPLLGSITDTATGLENVDTG